MTIYIRQNNYNNHTTYGGDITQFDFEGHHTLQTMANKISNDLRFDKICKQNLINKKIYR